MVVAPMENLEKLSSTTPMLPENSQKNGNGHIILTPKNGHGKILIREDTVLTKMNDKCFCRTRRTFCCSEMSSTKYALTMSLLIATFLASLAAVVVLCFTDTMNNAILSNMILKNNSRSYLMWKNPSVKPLLKVHIFNYTNLEEVINNKTIKLRVQDLGPYVYEETLDKVNVDFSEDEEQLTFQEQTSFEFIPELSSGTQHDQITIPNLPLLGVTFLAKSNKPPFVTRSMFEMTLATGLNMGSLNKPFVTLPAEKFIWGYDDPIVDFAKAHFNFIANLPFEKFGLLASKLGIQKEQLTINTGVKDLNRLNIIEKVNEQEELEVWSTKACNSLIATDGSMFPATMVDKVQTLSVFNRNLCRKLPFVYIKDEEIETLDNLLTYRYEPPSDVFNATNPENQCFCNLDTGSCPPSGLINITKCAYGSPSLASFPHFYLGDPILFKDIDGLKPDARLHKSYMNIHPRLGMPVAASMKFQINFQVHKISGLYSMDHLKDGMVLPVAWIEMTIGKIPQEVRSLIYHGTYSSTAIIMLLQAISGVVCFGSLILIFVTYQKRRPIASLNAEITK